MKEKKERILLACMVLIFGLLTASVTAMILEHGYSQRSFQMLSTVCQEMIESDPKTERAVMAALKAYSLGRTIPPENSRILAYGYGPADFFRSDGMRAAILSGCGALSGGLLLLAGIFWRTRREKIRVQELTDYVEQVNRGEGGILPQGREDALSRLQDEIYKTVTELYQTRDAALRARDHFAENLSNIAHQIRTPITAMDLTMQMMEQQAIRAGSTWGTGDSAAEVQIPETKRISDQVIQIRKQLRCLNRLEEALLLLARMEAGTLSIKREAVDVFTLLMLAADNLQEFSDMAGVSVDIQEAGEIFIHADLEWTMEAVMNILKNCVEHTPSGGIVRCRFEQNPLYTKIWIQDSGPGFQKEEIPHLFERFYRGKNAKEGSIGIGLPLARGIIESQNGTLCAGNLPKGGACFEIRFYSH